MMNWFKTIGSKDKAFQQDDEGRLLIAPQRGDSEILVFSKDNPLAPRSASDYELRDTVIRRHSFPHIWHPIKQDGNAQRSYRNIFDQTFVIYNTLDADIDVTFVVLEVASGPEISFELLTVALGSVRQPSGSTPTLMTLTPERTTMNVGRSTVIELPELRQPYPAFALQIKALSTPTTGEIKILNTRRY